MAFFRALEAKGVQERARVMPVKTLTLPADTPLKYALERLTLDHFTEIKIAPHGGNEEYSISEPALLNHIFAHGLHGTVKQVFHQNDKIRFKPV